MSYYPENALLVQSDRTILLEVHSAKAEAALVCDRPSKLPPHTFQGRCACPREKLPDLELG